MATSTKQRKTHRAPGSVSRQTGRQLEGRSTPKPFLVVSLDNLQQGSSELAIANVMTHYYMQTEGDDKIKRFDTALAKTRLDFDRVATLEEWGVARAAVRSYYKIPQPR